MTDKKEQQETARKVASVAGRVARLLRSYHTTKKHGGYDHYKDERIHISLDTFVPNVSIRVKVGDKWQYVYSAAYHSTDRPMVFRRGRWMDYLFGELNERAEQRQAALEADREVRRRSHDAAHFGPVDDESVFGTQ